MRNKNYAIVMAVFFATLLLLAAPVMGYTDEAVRWYTQGNALLTSGNNSQAIDAYDHAIALEPGYFEALDGKADALNRAGEFSAALAASSLALEANPAYVKGWINHGQILYNIGYYYEDTQKNPAKADEYYQEQLLSYEKAIQLDPGNAEAWFNKGYALAGLKRYDEAIAAFDKVQSLDPAYPKLALSQGQAKVLRDAATPVYVKYAVPLIGGVLLIFVIGAFFWYKRSSTSELEGEGAENRRARRKKEQ